MTNDMQILVSLLLINHIRTFYYLSNYLLYLRV